MLDKTGTLEDAVRFVRDGHTIALGGMTIYRRPVAFVQALINTEDPPRNLTLLSFTAGLAADMLVGAGMVEKIRTCYFGLESFGLAPMFTKAAGDGSIEIIEESEASIANGLRAKMAGVSFMPSLAWKDTDMFSVRRDVRIIKDPYEDKDLTAFPAIGCDVAVIHVLKADKFGNCRLGGNPTIDHELTLVAENVIITAEEVVETLETSIDFSGLPVSAVVHLPKGAWPTSCYPTYPIDGDEILRYIDACNKGEFEMYVQQLSR